MASWVDATRLEKLHLMNCVMEIDAFNNGFVQTTTNVLVLCLMFIVKCRSTSRVTLDLTS